MTTAIEMFRNYFQENRWILLVTLFLFVTEKFFSRDQYKTTYKKDNLQNVLYFFVNEILFNRFISVMIYSTLLQYVLRTYQNQIDNIKLFDHLTGFWSYVGVIFVYDLLQFHVHLATHKFGFLWNFHKSHHSTQTLNVTAVWRYSFIDSLCFVFFADIPLILLGFSAEALIFKNYFFQILTLYLHTDFKYNFKFLSRFMITPHLHLWHHASAPQTKTLYQNVGSLFNVWDRIYGVYYYSEEHPVELGLGSSSDFPETFVQQLIYPVTKKSG